MLQAKYSCTFDQDWFLTENHNIIYNWFNLYQFTKVKHDIIDKYMYNLGTNWYMIGIVGNFRVIISKYQK